LDLGPRTLDLNSQQLEQHPGIQSCLASPGVVHQDHDALDFLLQPANLRDGGGQLGPAVQVIVLGGFVPFDPPGAVPPLESHVGRACRGAVERPLRQAAAVHTRDRNALCREMPGRLRGQPLSPAELRHQRQAFQGIAEAAQAPEIVAYEFEPGTEPANHTAELSRLLQGPQRGGEISSQISFFPVALDQPEWDPEEELYDSSGHVRQFEYLRRFRETVAGKAKLTAAELAAVVLEPQARVELLGIKNRSPVAVLKAVGPNQDHVIKIGEEKVKINKEVISSQPELRTENWELETVSFLGGIMNLLTQTEIRERLCNLDGWAQTPEGIRKQYVLNDFRSAVNLVNRVADLAEEANHHPDILISYDRVTFTLITHDAGGITGKDFNLAARIEAIAP